MKKLLLGLGLSFLTATSLLAGINENMDTVEIGVKGIVVAETFKVYGNCGECEKKIESAALSLQGVKKAEWDKESKVLEVIFNNGKVSLANIKSKIAEAGYDMKGVKATEASYAKSSTCCKYERPKN